MDLSQTDAFIPLVVSGSRIAVTVPTPQGSWLGPLRATLFSGSTPVGFWDFTSGFPPPGPKLILSPTRLDQCFVTIDHSNSSPLADRFQLFALPEDMTDLVLQVETETSAGHLLHSYKLNWPTEGDFAGYVVNWRRVRIPPVEWFYVELTTCCNLSCPFCPSSILERPRTFMKLDLASRIFEQIADYRANRPSVFGYLDLNRMVFLHVMGEPLLHPHLKEIVSIAREHNILPALFTNATLLDDKNAEKIFDAGVTHLTLSLNVVTAAGYTGVGAKGTLQDQERRVISFLRRRAERGAFNIQVDIQYLFSAEETIAGEGLLESKDQVWKLFSRWLSLTRHLDGTAASQAGPLQYIEPLAMASPLSPDEGGDTSIRFPLSLGINLVIKRGCSFGNVMLPPGFTVIPADTGRCPFGNASRVMCVFVDGSVSFCSLDYENTASLGNLQSQSIEEIWKGDRLQHIRAGMEKGHLVEPVCQRCLGRVVHEEVAVN